MKNNPPDMFKMGMHVLMLIDRGASSSNKGSKRWINKIITRDVETWDKAADKLLELQNYIGDLDIRLYSSVNARCMKKAVKTFQHKQLDVIPEYEDVFYSRINDEFCSSLMQADSRVSSMFLLDHDTKDPKELNTFLIKNRDIKLHYLYPTPNGWHAIVDPFNPILMEGMVATELKKDALMLINWIEDKDV